jgi:hypothetical protein
LKRAIVRRMKSELRKELPPREDGTPRFARRDILPLEVDYPPEERRIHELLQVWRFYQFYPHPCKFREGLVKPKCL